MILRRNYETADCTLGEMITDDGAHFCFTLELPWRDNAHGASCILPGIYDAHRYQSPKRGYDVFMLDNVPDRSAIEIHIGNFPSDTDGCILVGERLAASGDAIEESGTAFRRLMAYLEGRQTMKLEIRNPPRTLA